MEVLKKMEILAGRISGEISYDDISRIIYATDASVYREKPLGVVYPKNKEDIKKIIQFASDNNVSLIPRTAGTSLAGQVVGNGLIVDVSKHLTKILELNTEKQWVIVEPGVVLDELNLFLKPHGLFFGPETSTSNRCMIGGMVGNNSCGSHSLIYGSTRDHTLAVECVLSDGSLVTFSPMEKEEFDSKCIGNSLENEIYRNIRQILEDEENQEQIRNEFPDYSIKRRNNGYAIDALLETNVFSKSGERFNFSKLLCGSEGTLAFTTQIKLNLVKLPPKEKGLLCVHLEDIETAFHANIVALQYHPVAVEMIDHVIIECTENSIEQRKNRFFIEGNPAALLLVEFASESMKDIIKITTKLENELRSLGMGYHFPLLQGNDINRVWSLRKAGLGLLSNLPGDAKPVAVIEDTAVNVHFLPDYMKELKELLDGHNLSCVYYAHIGTGELHLRPVLNLKREKDRELFRTIALETAKLVKSFNGSISGEHGDGRLRGEFLRIMIGDSNYDLLKNIKQVWDPKNIFNPGKIIDTPAMNTHLRYGPGQINPEFNTAFDFTATDDLLRSVERCNGSADCRKSEIIGGLMCPSFHATHDEKDTPRARANVLRENLTNSNLKNPFEEPGVKEILDWCLMCKGCKLECPSGVDIARIKSEVLHQINKSRRFIIKERIISNISSINKILIVFPRISNFVLRNPITSAIVKKMMGFSRKRRMPSLSNISLKKWAEKNIHRMNQIEKPKGLVYFFIDEFSNFNDAEIGIMALKTLTELGYQVKIANTKESGRAAISKGMLYKAKELAEYNVNELKYVITDEHPLLGIEPSALFTFVDEYPDLVGLELKNEAKRIAKNTMMVEDFLAKEINMKKITPDFFSQSPKHILLHGHCHQKSLRSMDSTIVVLSLPLNQKVTDLKSGCCGMAGSFGYEKKNYNLSMKVGEINVFSKVKDYPEDCVISAPGTSCRQQIEHGTKRKAYHPIELIYDSLL